MQGKNSPLVLGTESIGKLIIKYSVPAIIAMTATSLYNIVDSIFIGHGVGAMAIAGLAITFPLMNLLMAFCALIAVGGATISSIFLGQKDEQRAAEVLNNVFTMCLVNGIIFGSVTYVFLKPILMFFGATNGTVGYASEFMEIILMGTPISYVFLGLNFLIRATGYPMKAMVSVLLTVLANIVLAPIFIFVLGWGMKGAALATILSQTLSLIWVVSHFLNKNSYIRFRKGEKWLDLKILSRIIGIGLSPFIMNVCACVVVIFINKALLAHGGSAGDLAVGTYGIINRTAMLFVMIVFGITQGMQPILGYNFGANQWDRVKKTLRIGITVAVSITTLGWAIGEFMPGVISRMFTGDNILIDMANNGFRLSFIAWPFIGAQIVIQNFFQSIGKPKISIFLSFTRQLIFLVPLLIIFPQIWGIDGVWISLSASDFIASLLAVVILVFEVKKLNKRFHNLKPISGQA